MGKKSVMDAPALPAEEAPAEPGALAELLQDFLRVALQAQLDAESRPSSPVRSCSVRTCAPTGRRSFNLCLFVSGG